jgi:cytochrome c oxidase subunit 4
VYVWIYLLIITAVEVVLAYAHLLSTLGMLVLLMALSLVKAALIVAYFMHLRFERRSLIFALVPSVVVVIALLFAFFPDSFRLLHLRVQ